MEANGTKPARRHRDVAAIIGLLVLAWVPPVLAGEPLVLKDMDGHSHDADAIVASGHPVVLVFWQTWCTSCKREAPHLARAIEQYGDRIEFFGVVSGPDRSVDDAKVREVAQKWGHTQPQIRDRDLSLTRRFKVFGTPVIIVLGEGMHELFRGYRLPDDWSPYLEAVHS